MKVSFSTVFVAFPLLTLLGHTLPCWAGPNDWWRLVSRGSRGVAPRVVSPHPDLKVEPALKYTNEKRQVLLRGFLDGKNLDEDGVFLMSTFETRASSFFGKKKDDHAVDKFWLGALNQYASFSLVEPGYFCWIYSQRPSAKLLAPSVARSVGVLLHMPKELIWAAYELDAATDTSKPGQIGKKQELMGAPSEFTLNPKKEDNLYNLDLVRTLIRTSAQRWHSEVVAPGNLGFALALVYLKWNVGRVGLEKSQQTMDFVSSTFRARGAKLPIYQYKTSGKLEPVNRRILKQH